MQLLDGQHRSGALWSSRLAEASLSVFDSLPRLDGLRQGWWESVQHLHGQCQSAAAGSLELSPASPSACESLPTFHGHRWGLWEFLQHLDDQDQNAALWSSRIFPARPSLCDTLPTLNGHSQVCGELLRHLDVPGQAFAAVGVEGPDPNLWPLRHYLCGCMQWSNLLRFWLQDLGCPRCLRPRHMRLLAREARTRFGALDPPRVRQLPGLCWQSPSRRPGHPSPCCSQLRSNLLPVPLLIGMHNCTAQRPWSSPSKKRSVGHPCHTERYGSALAASHSRTPISTALTLGGLYTISPSSRMRTKHIQTTHMDSWDMSGSTWYCTDNWARSLK